MTGILIAFAIASPMAALAAWLAWLVFNYHIAKEHGVDGLRVTPNVSRSFNLRDWVLAVPAQLVRALVELLTREPTS